MHYECERNLCNRAIRCNIGLVHFLSLPPLSAGTYLEQASSAGPCLNCSIAKALYDPGLNATKHDNEADCKNWQVAFSLFCLLALPLTTTID